RIRVIFETLSFLFFDFPAASRREMESGLYGNPRPNRPSLAAAYFRPLSGRRTVCLDAADPCFGRPILAAKSVPGRTNYPESVGNFAGSLDPPRRLLMGS